ncbi:MAG: hypothetical protein R3F19_12865 [Verrucomicrobiales bacterium]
MNTLVSKDEPLRTSLVHIGYLIIKELEKAQDQRLSLGELSLKLRKKQVVEYRPIMFALLFLHVTDVIDFHAPYVRLLSDS